MSKPKIEARELMRDGNAFWLISVAIKAALAAGWSEEEIAALTNDMTGGDYKNLFKVINDRFDLI